MRAPRRRLSLLALLVLALAVLAGTVGPAGDAPAAGLRTAAAPRVTVIADSVAGALVWMGEARVLLSRGIDLDLEIAACRKLDGPGCVYAGDRPTSAVDVARSRQAPFGRVVVVDVGYNDLADGYGDGVDRVMKALVAREVERVVWVTLRETTPTYRAINAAIAQAARRWPQMVVGDWDAASEGRDAWFSDGVHMTVEGGVAFARFLRPLVVDACGAACGPDGDVLVVGSTKLGPARARTPFRERLVARGGTAPYRFGVRGLPRPLRVTPAGVVSGSPRVSGRYRLEVTVTDARGVANQAVVMLRVAPRG